MCRVRKVISHRDASVVVRCLCYESCSGQNVVFKLNFHHWLRGIGVSVSRMTGRSASQPSTHRCPQRRMESSLQAALRYDAI